MSSSCWKAEAAFQQLLLNASDPSDRARLLAVSHRESGAWLLALPISNLGLRLDDDSVKIAVGLRLGTPLCSPHHCKRCGQLVDSLGRHGLSCRRSEGRHSRHAALNSIISRALSSANVPSRLEPPGLSRSDGKRPDRVTIIPWSSGKPLVWDATCPDTFACSYLGLSAQSAGEVATRAEALKLEKYSNLTSSHFFTPIAIESSGVFGPKTMSFIKDLGKRITRQSGDPRSTAFLLQSE